MKGTFRISAWLFLGALLVALTVPAQLGAGPVTEIKIGAVYPLTGALASSAKLSKDGIDFAVDIINNRYDLALPLAKTEGLPNLGGAKIRVIFGDTQGSPETGRAETERLITGEKVAAVVGAYQSAVTATASMAAERLGVPFLNPDSTSPTLIQRGFKWFFRATPDDDIMSKNFFDFLKDLEKKKGIKVRTVALVCENTLWGTDVCKFERKYAKDYGYEVVAEMLYPARSTDLTSEVQRLKAARPDVVFMASYISDAILYTQTMKKLDFNTQAILAMDAGHVDPAFLKTVGKDGNYIFSREVFSADLGQRKPIVRIVNEMFKKRYGYDLEGTSARSFTAMFVLADAINRAGSTEPSAIRRALLETYLTSDKIIMPWGGVRFDPANGQNVLGRGIIVQIQDLKYWTVWPWHLASRDVIWPMPTWRERK